MSMTGGAHHPQPHSNAVHHGLASLTHEERLAAQSALSRISSTSVALGAKLSAITQSATMAGGSVKAPILNAPTLMPGAGSDTFIGGAHGSNLSGLGSDTVVSGSTGSAFHGISGAESLTAPAVANIALSSDTINIAGATATSLKPVQHEESKAGSHTVSVGDKTTVTVSGLSAHDVAKLPH